MHAILREVVTKAISGIPECLAAGYVDVQSGLLLEIKTVNSLPKEVIDLLAAATGDLFQGPNVKAIEKIFRKARGIDNERHYFQEIIVNSDNLVHVFLRGKKYPDYVAVFVCRNIVNIGMVLTKARLALPAFEAAM